LKFLSQELMSLLAFKSWIEKLGITQKILYFVKNRESAHSIRH